MPVETRNIMGSIGPGRRLPEVLSEIIDRLTCDDWYRFAEGEDGKWFYIIGYEAYTGYEGGEDYAHLEVPQREDVGPLAQWYVNAQIAQRHGEGKEELIALLQKLASGRLTDPKEKARLMTELYDDLFVDILKGGAELSELPDEVRSRIEAGREKLCLREIRKRYAKMVDRWERLEPLSFEDPQLAEASRCYLYGFYRATIALSAAAVETQLKRATGRERSENYPALVREAVKSGKLGSEFEQPANDMFKTRNEVVHEGDEPEKDLAMEILDRARLILSALKKT